MIKQLFGRMGLAKADNLKLAIKKYFLIEIGRAKMVEGRYHWLNVMTYF